MEDYKKRFALTLAGTGALFFDTGLVLKDGRPTPYFVNTAMFRTGRLGFEMGVYFAGMMVAQGLLHETDIVLGPSYKGSAIALATTIAIWQYHQLDIAFEYDRKEVKTHGEVSKGKGLFVNQALFDGCRIFVVDDVATSMGTKLELLEKLEAEARIQKMSFRIIGIGIGIDREQTTAVYDQEGKVILGEKGKNAIQEFVEKTGIQVYSVAGIREVVDFLYKEKVPVTIEGKRVPIDQKAKDAFDSYLETYGASEDE